MPLITRVPEPNLWEQICKEFAAERPPFPELEPKVEGEESSVVTELIDFDPAKHSPVFYNQIVHQEPNIDCEDDFDPTMSHPAAVGHCFLDRPPRPSPPPPSPPPNKKTCSPREYLQHYIFPILTPALEYMLRRAKEEKCFQRRRTAFNALDCLTEYLYNNNPDVVERGQMQLGEIPFVSQWWEKHPRAPLPKSLLWSDEEAALVIQSHYRGYCARKQENIQELRQWQREWREMNRDARERVNDFWEKRLSARGERKVETEGDEEKNEEEEVQEE